MSAWTAEDELMLKAAYQGDEGGRNGFAWTVAYTALEEHFVKEAERLTKPLNEGTESLDEFVSKLQPIAEIGNGRDGKRKEATK